MENLSGRYDIDRYWGVRTQKYLRRLTMIITLYPNFRALVSILICLTSINLYNTLSAQPVSYRIEQIPLRGELSNFEGTCFLQDNDGFMWFGSKDGLYRYDGINFKVYRNDPLDSNSLSSNYVHWIMEDHEGIIWIGMNSGGGVNRFDKYTETFKQYFAEPDNYLTDRWIEHMIEDREGIFWIGTYLGFSRADKKTKKVKNYAVNRADTSVSQDPHRIWYLFEDADGFIWVQYGMDGLCRFDTESESIVIIPNTPCDLNQIYEDKTGRLWITSWDGLYLFDRKKKLFERYLHESDNPNRLKNQMVKTIMEDVSSNLWIRTYDGIYKYNQDLELMFHWKHSHEYTRTPIYGDITKQMYEDNNGMIWFFTRDGINKIVKTYNYCKVYNQDPANNSFVNCIFLENKDLIWFGALNGLYSFNRITNTFKLHYGTLTDVEAHPYHTYAVHIDQKGILWMGTREGLCKMIKGINGGEQYKIYMFQSGNSSNLKRVPVAHIFEDSERRLWI